MLRCEFHENGKLRKSVKNDDDGLMEYRYGGFLTWLHPQIIHFDWIFLDKSSILGYPHLRTPPVSSNEFGFQRWKGLWTAAWSKPESISWGTHPGDLDTQAFLSFLYPFCCLKLLCSLKHLKTMECRGPQPCQGSRETMWLGQELWTLSHHLDLSLQYLGENGGMAWLLLVIMDHSPHF